MQSESILPSNEPSESDRLGARPRGNNVTPLLYGAVAVTAIASGAVILLDVQTFLRPFVALWLFAFCPGFPIARWLRVADPLGEVGLSVVISLGITSMIAGLMLYSGFWSVSAGTLVITGVSVFSAVVQIVALKRQECAG